MPLLQMTPSRIALKLVFFTFGFMQANLIARLPRLIEMLSMDNRTLGIAFFTVALGSVLSMPVAGWLTARTSDRSLAMVALPVYFILFPLIPLMPGTNEFVGFFLILGMGSGMFNVLMNAQAFIIEKELKKPLMTSFHALFSIGMFAGAGCGSMFVKLDFDVFSHMLIICIASISVLAFALRYFRDSTTASERQVFSLRLPSTSMLGIGTIIFCSIVGEGAISEWSTTYMVNVVNVGQVLAPWALSAFALAMTTGRIFGDQARAHLGDRDLMLTCSAVALAGLLLTVSFDQFWIVTAGFFLVGLGLSVIIPLAYSIACSTGDVPPAVAVSMVATIGYTGFLLNAPIIGFLAHWFSLKLALGSIGLLFVIMALMSRFYRGKLERG